MSKPTLVSLVYRRGAVTDVLSEQSLWLNAAQTGSALSLHLFLWHKPRNDKDRPRQRHDSHLRRIHQKDQRLQWSYTEDDESCGNILYILYSLFGKNSQRECVISLTARLERATEARKVCVLRWANVKGVWCTFRRVNTKASLNRNRPTSDTCS